MSAQLEHWMMFSTFAEQNHFIYPTKETYNGVIFNANMVAHAPAGLADFVIGKLHKECKYIIDPITHAFQHEPKHIQSKDGSPKSSISMLSMEYGNPFDSCCSGKRSLSPEILNKDIDSYVANVLKFQRDYLHSYMEKSDMAKYITSEELKKPAYLVAPYFFMSDTNWEQWVTCNVNAAKESVNQKQAGEKLLVEIVIDKGILDSCDYEKVIDRYTEILDDLDGCIIWVDELDEVASSQYLLGNFKKMCQLLIQKFRFVLNLHGGYFSVLLGSDLGGRCLSAVAHGPEFGEFRSVVPVGGGIPISKYYIPDIHVRANYRTALDWFETAKWLISAQVFHHEVCNCHECRRVINQNADNFVKFDEGEVKYIKRKHGLVAIKYPTQDTKLRCLRHYLENKHIEFCKANNKTGNVLLDELDFSISKYEQIVGYEGLKHLLRWKAVLS